MPAKCGLFIGDSMDRQIVYPGQILPETSLLQMAKDAMIGLAKLSATVTGTSTMASGFAVTPTGPASLQVVCAPGEIYSLTSIDALAFSSLPADTTHSIMKQGILLDGVTLSCPAPGTSGQSINYLVQVTYQDSDSTPVLLPYYNSANPALPYSGMGNNGLTQNTARKGIAVVSVKAGASAVTGSQVTPAPDVGYVGLYVVTVAFGQTTITSGSIAQYSGAPLLPSGFIQALQSGSPVSANDIGTANVYAANFTPAITVLTDKMMLRLKAANANTAASTFTPAPGVIAAAPIVGGAHAALQGGEIVQNGEVWLQYNTSVGAGSWIIIASSGGAMQVAPATKSAHAMQLSQMAAITGGMKNARMSIPTPAGGPTFTADEIVVSTALGGLSYRLSNFSKLINGGATGAGGMDVGTAPASGYVAIYAIYNPNAPLSGSNPALLGVNATAAAQPEVYGGANMPAGYTASALVSVWPTTPGTAFAAGYQADRTISFGGKSVLSGGTAVTATATSIASAVPRNAKTCAGYAINNAANGVIQIGADANYSGGGLVGVGNVSPATAPIWGWFATPIITPQTIYYAATQAASQNGVIWLSSYTF